MQRTITNIQLRDFIESDGTVAFTRLFRALGLTSVEDFPKLLFYLYAMDWRVAFAVNERLLEIAAGRYIDPTQLPLEPPSLNPLAWLHADEYCNTCPGSEMISFGEFSYPRCANTNRVERYNECLKYREQLKSGEATPAELDMRAADVINELKRFINDYGSKADS